MVRNVHVRIGYETKTDFVHVPLELADPHQGFNDKLKLPTDKEEMSTKHIPIRC